MGKKREALISRFTAWHMAYIFYMQRMRYEEGEFNKIGLTFPQFNVLLAIKNIPDPVTPTAIAKWLDRKVVTITLMLNRMSKDGWVKQRRSQRNRRILVLKITPKGEEMLSEASKPLKKVPDKIMSCLSDEELQNFITVTKKLLGTLYQELKLEGDVIESYTSRIEAMVRMIDTG